MEELIENFERFFIISLLVTIILFLSSILFWLAELDTVAMFLLIATITCTIILCATFIIFVIKLWKNR
jgi:heme/copper-type cytochrome/quinol oxidase subunit 3